MPARILNIAFCFNKKSDALEMAQKLDGLATEVNLIISENFDGFLTAIAENSSIHCFIIEENLKEFRSLDLIEKLKSNEQFKKSAIFVQVNEFNNIDKKLLSIGVDHIYEKSADLSPVIPDLRKIIFKKIMPIIPADFNVLVLDDNPDALEVISMNLTEMGHTKFDLYLSLADAKKNLLKKDYDFLLLDWNLLDGTCIDLIEFIQTNDVSARTKDALTMVITGRNEVDDIMTLLVYGIKDHIIKPFDFHEFEDKIDYAMERHNKQQKTRV